MLSRQVVSQMELRRARAGLEEGLGTAQKSQTATRRTVMHRATSSVSLR